MKKIKLTQEKYALVDDHDYDWLNGYKWYAKRFGNNWYAARNIRENGVKKTVLMHRFILGISDREIHVDHADLNSLNNSRKNIRIATRTQNATNINVRKDCKSGYKGVRYNKRNKYRKWSAQISTKEKCIWLGSYFTPEEAAKAYDKKAKELYGEFSRLNFR